MLYDFILKNIAKHIQLTEDEAAYFTSLLKRQAFLKKDFLLREGQLCKNLSFVKSGTLRAFYTNNEGKESTIMFATSDWWVTDMHCFINQLPAMLNIQALEKSEVFQLQKSALDKLYVKIPKFERFFRVMMQNAYIREQLRVIENLSLPAEQRYNNFINKYPKIVQQVTQKQVASYLGISPEFLSAIRSKKSKKNIS
jgi:CRP/FNR family transcriptional regulator, anaerobic regulatory protein